MNHAVESSNKALVLEAFDTLFNKRDYVTAERYWSPDYIQHSAHIEPGRDGLFKPAPHHEKSVHDMLDQVIAWGVALRPLRET